MDRYQRVEKPRPETQINENEIRITTQGRMRNYITYATTLLQVQNLSLSLSLSLYLCGRLYFHVYVRTQTLLAIIFVQTMLYF
jgi:hypothetical protein